MKRLRRWLFNLAAGVSLVVCVLALGGWVLGAYRYTDLRVIHGRAEPDRRWLIFDLTFDRGTVTLGLMTMWNASPPNEQPGWRFTGDYMPQEPPWTSQRLVRGFELVSRGWSISSAKYPQGYRRTDAVKMPLLIVAALAAIPPVIWLRAFVRNRRRGQWLAGGRCPKCGYDLRATPDRCPECGAVPEAAT